MLVPVCDTVLLLLHITVATSLLFGAQIYIIWANKPRNPVDRYLTNAFYSHKNLTRIWQRVDRYLTRGCQRLTRVDKSLTTVDKSWQEFDNELTDIWQEPCKSLVIWYLPKLLLSTKAIRFSRAYSHRLSSINNNSKTCFISNNIKNWCKYKENGNIMS